MIKNKKRIIISLIIIAIVMGYIFLGIENKNNIDRILETSNYSYLPVEAKNYIKEVYEETGEIILTENNKQANVPYLNPEYVEYLSNSGEDTNNNGLIPDKLIIDYIYNENNVVSAPHETYYNISDSNNRYITPIKDQKSLGLCWAYALIENAESYLMKSNNKMYEEGTTEILSVRQLDYATSYFGIKDYINPYDSHNLGNGDSLGSEVEALASGRAFYGESWKYNDSYSLEKLEYAEVFDSSLSNYELNTMLYIPYLNKLELDLSNSEDLEKIDNWNNLVKDSIKTYGGPSISIQAPAYSCAAYNYYDNSKYIIDVNSTCEHDGPHAMQIVGWDDDYEYKYCVNGSKNDRWTADCSSENTVEGKGVWILRNSWGNYQSFAYLAYNSNISSVHFITSLEKSTDRKWDYIYDERSKNIKFERDNGQSVYNPSMKSYITRYTSYYSIVPKTNINSKLQKIKFSNSYQQENYKIYFSSSGEEDDYVLISDETYQYPGYVTVDVSSVNYIITKNSKIKFVSPVNDAYDVMIFTKELSNSRFAFVEDKYYEQTDDIKENNLYKLRLQTKTYNIPEGSQLIYKLFNQNGEDITSQMNVRYNTVNNNMANTLLYLPDIGDSSYFTINVMYDDVVLSTSKIYASLPSPSIGSGTVEDPYVIMTPSDLYSINYHLDAHYVLGQDIDMTYDTQDENGLFYNSGRGWEGIGYKDRKSFTGSIDGNFHKIIGLKASNSGGFIYLINNIEQSSSLKNIIFEKKEGYIFYEILSQDDEESVNIENIAIIDSKLNTGVIASCVISRVENGVNISGIYVGNSYEAGSIFGSLETIEDDDSNASINISNLDIRMHRYNYAGRDRYTVNILGSATGDVKISNVIVGYKTRDHVELISRAVQSPSGKMPHLKNIYYLDSIDDCDTLYNDYTKENVKINSFSYFKNINKYSSWDNFDENWEIKDVDGITRFPALKFTKDIYKYTTVSVDEFEIGLGESINIYDYVSPASREKNNLTYYSLEKRIATVDDDGNIKGIKAGTGVLHLSNDYDGYEKNINIVVKESGNVEFNKNDGSNDKNTQIMILNKATKLNKNTFERLGYKFTGWNTKPDGSGTAYEDEQLITITTGLSLYAMWSPIEYSVSFDSNTGVGSMDSLTIKYDEEKTLPENTFTKEGYHFIGWNTEPDGSGTKYGDKQKVLNLTSKDNETIELYAQWVDASVYDLISRINITGVTQPLAGQKPDFSVETDTQGVSIIKTYWIDEGSGKELSETDRFQLNKKYILRLELETEEKYMLCYNVAFVIDAKELKYDYDSSTNEIRLYYEAKPAPKIATLPTLKVKNANNNTLALSWTNISYAEKYFVYRSTDNKKFTKIATVTENKYTDKGLVYGKKYYYKVKAYNSTSSTTSKVVSGKTVPNKVTNFDVKSAGSNNIKLKWDQVKVTGYQLKMSKDNKNWTTVNTITNNSTLSYNHKKLTANKTYYYKIRAYKTVSGNKVYGSWSDVIKTKTAPAIPTLKLSMKYYEKINVSVGETKGATSYKIEKSIDGKTYEELTTLTDTNKYVLENAEFLKKYYIRVKACSKYGCSGWISSSIKSTVKTPKLTLTTNSKKVTITVNEVDHADAYYVYRSTSKNGDYSLIKILNTGENMTFNNKTVKGTTYFYKVRAAVSTETKTVYSAYSSPTKIVSK